MWDVRYRPRRFDEVLGQEGVVQVLKARVMKGSVSDTSYIFAGGPGQGKTTLARILARAALCPRVDKSTGEPCNECEQCVAVLDGLESAFEERDAASGGGIDAIRSMLDNIPFSPPMGAPFRIWLFDEAHQLSAASQNALLKPIEEKKIVSIFCTTEGRKIVGPVYRRCEEHPIHKVPRDQILTKMKQVLSLEKVDYEEDAVLTVIDHAGGHVRDVYNKLESLSQLGAISLVAVRESLNLNYVSAFFEVLLSLGDPPRVVRLVEDLCESISPEDISAGIAEAAMNAFRLSNGMRVDFSFVDRGKAQQVYQRFGATILKVAEYFLRSKFVTKVSLTCDVVTLVQSNGVIPQDVTAQPIVYSIPAPVAAAVPPAPVAEPQEAPAEVPETPPAPLTASAPLPPSAVSVQAPKANGSIRSDKIGPRGSNDPCALTSVDHIAVPREHPRMMSVPPPNKLDFKDSSVKDEDLTPGEWRREFENLWDRFRSRS